MKIKEDDQARRQHLETVIHEMADAGLKNILKKRDQYQEYASRLAVNEAIARGIIRSDEDLNLPEYRIIVPKYTLFPVPESEEIRSRLIRSLSRSLMIAGAIPAFYGILKFTWEKYAEGAGLVSLGIIWIAMAWFIMEKYEKRLVWPMILLALVSLVYIIRIMLLFNSLKWTDYVIPAVLYLFLFYTLFYIRVILNKQQSDTKNKV